MIVIDNIEHLNEMANLLPSDTGVKYKIWISVKNASHGPRIKVFESTPTGRNFSISISETPEIVAGKSFTSSKEFQDISKFILLNKVVLLDYWYGRELDSIKVSRMIKRI